MTPTPSKPDLLRIPGVLKITGAVQTSKEAQAIAERDGYIAWFWDKRAKRLYGKLADTQGVARSDLA